MTMINAVDETSLAASPTERRNSLEKHLLNRPDPHDLKERHILLDTNVAPYASMTLFIVLPILLTSYH